MSNFRSRARLTLLFVLPALLAGCGGGSPGASPTSPTPPSPAPATPPGPVLNLAGVGLDVPKHGLFSVQAFEGDPVRLSWNAATGAADYVIEIGTQAGARDVLTAETAATSYEWRPTGVAVYYVQVAARNAAGLGTKSSAFSIAAYSFKEFVEMLFLGTGRYADQASPGCNPGRMQGWRDGSNIRVVASTSLSESAAAPVRTVTEQLELATGGVLRAHFTSTSETRPQPGDGEITVAYFAGSECGISGAVGCAQTVRVSSGFTNGVSIYLSPASSPGPGAHEMGHAALGFCHVDVRSTSGPSFLTVMGSGISGGRLTEADVRAVRAVYGAGLRAGARRADFVAAGLVDP